jgi:hypothetical protein
MVHPVSGGHKYGGLVLQVEDWEWGLISPPCKNPVFRKCKEGYDPQMAVMPNVIIQFNSLF